MLCNLSLVALTRLLHVDYFVVVVFYFIFGHPQYACSPVYCQNLNHLFEFLLELYIESSMVGLLHVHMLMDYVF